MMAKGLSHFSQGLSFIDFFLFSNIVTKKIPFLKVGSQRLNKIMINSKMKKYIILMLYESHLSVMVAEKYFHDIKI